MIIVCLYISATYRKSKPTQLGLHINVHRSPVKRMIACSPRANGAKRRWARVTNRA